MVAGLGCYHNGRQIRRRRGHPCVLHQAICIGKVNDGCRSWLCFRCMKVYVVANDDQQVWTCHAHEEERMSGCQSSERWVLWLLCSRVVMELLSVPLLETWEMTGWKKTINACMARFTSKMLSCLFFITSLVDYYLIFLSPYSWRLGFGLDAPRFNG